MKRFNEGQECAMRSWSSVHSLCMYRNGAAGPESKSCIVLLKLSTKKTMQVKAFISSHCWFERKMFKSRVNKNSWT